MSEKPEKDHLMRETATVTGLGDEFEEASKLYASPASALDWLFEKSTPFSGEDSSSGMSAFQRKSREGMLAETVALAQKLSAQKVIRPFQVSEEEFNGDEVFFGKQELSPETQEFPLKTSEKNSELLSGGSFFASVALSVICLFFSFFMLGMPHFPGVAGFIFLELVAALLLCASRSFLKGWGNPERSFRMGIFSGFLAWEALFLWLWGMFVTALWLDQSLFLLQTQEASATLLSFVGALAVFTMSFLSLRAYEWAHGKRLMMGVSGMIFLSLFLSGAVIAFVGLVLGL
ncbi:hypothetical protein FAI40_01845 [Acetobacteraceae bacterium]|nr:hypothetical protein FAI40_01845 [Acetobacteraceae bacterium]